MFLLRERDAFSPPQALRILVAFLMARSGRWVFVPTPKWKKVPPGYYSIRRADIYIKLHLRNVNPSYIAWCVDNLVEPPPRMRRARLEAWIRAVVEKREGERKHQIVTRQGRLRAARV